jgi:hypothetical protein
MTAAGAFNRLFDETMADLRFEIDGEKLPLEPTLNLMQDPMRTVRRKGAEALAARPSSQTCALFTLITNTLAKDKEISDRWRGFKDIADARHLSNRVEPEVVDALVEAVRAAYPKLSHRYYRMKASGSARTSSCTGTATRRCRRRTARDPWGRPRTWFCPPTENFARTWPKIAGASSTSAGSTRRPPGQGARCLRPSDGALGAPLCAAQLPGQAARRDDARP